MKKALLFLVTVLAVLSAYAQVDIDKAINLSNTNPSDAKISGIKSVSAAQDAVSVEAFQKGSFIYAGTSGGTSAAYTVALTPPISAYVSGMVLYFKTHTANGTGPVTINVNSLGTKIIKKNGAQDLAAGDIANGQVACLIYDGTQFHLISQISNSLSSVTTNATLTGNGTSGSPLDIATVGAGGSFNNVTVNTKGQVTGGSNVAYLTSEVDGSTTNELQTISGSGANDVSLSSGGGTITLQGSGATSISRSGNTFTISSTDNNSGGTVTGTGTTNQVARWTSASALGTGALFDNGSNVALGTTTANNMLQLRSDGNTQAMQFNTSGYMTANQWGTRIFKQDIGGGIPLKVENQSLNTWYGSADFDHGQNNAHPSLKTYYSTQLAVTSGNVGIGNTNPAAKLTVGGGFGLSAASTTFTANAGTLGSTAGNTLKLASIGFYSANESSLGIEARRSSNGSDWTTTAIGLKYDVDATSPVNSAQIWLTAAGNVGIGLANPSSKLEVLGGPVTLSNSYLYMNRVGYVNSGISWYSPSYTSWSQYMSPAGLANSGPTGNITAPSGTYVTSWALRNFIEHNSGYGWTFESGTNTSTTPTVKFEIRSSDGLFHSYSGGLIDGNLSVGTSANTNRAEFGTGSVTLSGSYLDINRDSYVNSGISWYGQGYPSWSDYMSPAGQTGAGPHGDLTAPSGTYVTSWAKRDYIENAGGYGWTWESAANTTTPAVKFEIRSNDGLFHSTGSGVVDGNLTVAGTAKISNRTVPFQVVSNSCSSSTCSASCPAGTVIEMAYSFHGFNGNTTGSGNWACGAAWGWMGWCIGATSCSFTAGCSTTSLRIYCW